MSIKKDPFNVIMILLLVAVILAVIFVPPGLTAYKITEKCQTEGFFVYDKLTYKCVVDVSKIAQ